MKLDAYRFFVI